MFGPITVQVWGMFVALGMLLSAYIIYKRSIKYSLDTEFLMNMTLAMIIGGIVFARVFHVVFYNPTYYLFQPVAVLKVWEGGLSSFGGLFGAIVVGSMLWLKKKFPRTLLLSYSDVLSFGALYGWIVGRIGCFCIHDHLGIPCSCALALQAPGGARLDMALLEIIGLLPLAIVFFVFRSKNIMPGWFTAVLLGYYGVLRFVLDFFRARDIPFADARYIGLTPAQYFAMVLLFFSVSLLYVQRKKHAVSAS